MDESLNLKDQMCRISLTGLLTGHLAQGAKRLPNGMVDRMLTFYGRVMCSISSKRVAWVIYQQCELPRCALYEAIHSIHNISSAF